jgi:hypothetical protein
VRRYIHWLEKDLEEYPNDPRTLYYLGHGHWEIFLANHGASRASVLEMT